MRTSLRIRPRCRPDRAMRAAGSPLQRRSARRRRPRGRPRSGCPGRSHPFVPNSVKPAGGRSALKAGLFRARHHGAQKDGLEITAVIGEVAMRLTKDRNDLRHLETEHPVRVSERGPMTARVVLYPSVVCAQIWMRCPASGAPSPARRTVPVVQKPPCRSDPRSPRPGGSCWNRPTSKRSVRGLARGGQRRPEIPVAGTAPPAARRVRRLNIKMVMQIPPGDRAVASRKTAATTGMAQLREAKSETGRNNSVVNGCSDPNVGSASATEERMST